MIRKIRIAIIISRITQLGPVKVIQSLVNSLCKSEEFRLKLFYLDKAVDTCVTLKIPAERLDIRKFCFSDFDIIHTNGLRPDLFAFIYRKKIRYHISTIHNNVFEDLSLTYNRFISWIFGNIWLILWRSADKLICISKSMKNYYSGLLPISKMEAIYNGISESDDSFIPDEKILSAIENFHSGGLKVIGSAGIMTRRKGIDQILNLMSAEKGFALVIIGDGKELQSLMRLANRLKISDRCLFCGFRENAVMYYKYFDFYVMSSRSEGFGLALIEAVQQKVPVICSDIDVFKELFNKEQVTFFKLDSPSSLSDALKTSMETGKKKVDSAYKSYLNNYTAGKMANQYNEFYKSLPYSA